MTAHPTPRERARPDYPAVVHTYTDVLRHLRDHGDRTAAGLAEATGRVPSNVKRDLHKLAAADVITIAHDFASLTDKGRQWLAGMDVAEGAAEAPASTAAAAAGMLDLTHAQILPDPANARRDWDSDEARGELDALRADIVQNGLLQNLVVRTAPPGGLQGVSIARTDPVTGERTELPLYVLVGGERRWRAIGAAIADGDWPEARAIPCRVLDADDRTARLAALAENLQRRALNPIEEANAFRDLTDAGVAGDAALTTAELAERIGVTQRQIQLRLQLLELDAADQHRMTLGKEDPRRLSVREARLKLQRRADTPEPVQISPEQALIMVELAHKSAADDENGYTQHYVDVAPDTRERGGEALIALTNSYWVHLSTGPSSQSGQYTARAAWQAAGWLRNAYPDFHEEGGADRALAHAQEAVGGLQGDGPYVNEWLNGPFEITDEGRAAVEERERREAEHKERRDQAAAEDAARRKRWAEARAQWLAALGAPALPPATLSETLQAIDHPLPWTPVLDGSIRDAAGEEVGGFNTYNPDDQDITLALAVAAAVNAAAGLPTPEPIDPASEADDEDAADDEAAEGDTFTDDEAEAAGDAADAEAA